MDIPVSKALVPFQGYQPLVPIDKGGGSLARHHHNDINQNKIRLIVIGDEVDGVYGPSGRKVIFTNNAMHLDIYI